MKHSEIIKLVESCEPLAILRYFEWPTFSNDYAKARYTILRIDRKNNDIHEIEIPFNLVPFVISKTGCFEEVIRLNEGIVWERMGFREIVKSSIPKAKIHQLINKW